MAVRHLNPVPASIAPEVYDLSRGPETTAQRVRRLQSEARLLAREQIEQLVHDLEALSAHARDIAEGGDAYPVGAREMASRMAEDLPYRALSLTALLERQAVA